MAINNDKSWLESMKSTICGICFFSCEPQVLFLVILALTVHDMSLDLSLYLCNLGEILQNHTGPFQKQTFEV